MTDPKLPQVVLHSFTRSDRFDVGISLLESWLSNSDAPSQEAVRRLATQFYGLYGRLPEELIPRLEAILNNVYPGEEWRELPKAIGLTLLKNGLNADAHAVLMRLLSQDGGVLKADARIIDAVATAEMSLGQYEDAVAKYTALLERAPDDMAARLALAKGQMLLGNYRTAFELYTRANEPKRAGYITLAEIVLPLVITFGGETQRRRTDLADQVSRETTTAASDDELMDIYNRCIALDAVSSNSWRPFVVMTIRKEDKQQHAMVFAIMSFLTDGDIDWIWLAAMAAHDSGNVALFAIAIEYGLELFAEQFVERLCGTANDTVGESDNLRRLVLGIAELKKQGLAIALEHVGAHEDGLPMIACRGVDTMPEREGAASQILERVTELRAGRDHKTK